MTYFGVAFHLMTWARIWIFLQNTAFVSYIGLYIIFILVVKVGIFGKTKSKHHKEKPKDEETAPLTEQNPKKD